MEPSPELARALTLEGKVAVITGAGSGLGQEAARIFALAGARPVLADLDEAKLAVTAGLVSDAAGPVLCRSVDVSRREQVDALADEAVAQTGRLDVWVNCAGISFLHSILETDPERAQQVVAVNMMGAYWGCAAAGRVMRDRGGARS